MSQSHAAPGRTNTLDVPEGQRPALCCECGEGRTLSTKFHNGRITSDNVKVAAQLDLGHADEWGTPQKLQMLRCNNCRRQTAHATCSELGRSVSTRDEAIDRSRTALDWFNQWFPDWRIHLVSGDEAHCTFAFDPDVERYVVVITDEMPGDQPLDLSLRVLTAAAHLSLGHVEGPTSSFSVEQSDDAESLALDWMDRIVETLSV